MRRGRWLLFQSRWMAGICHFMLLRGIAPVPSSFGRFFWMLLDQGQKFSLLSQCIFPGIQYRLRAPGLVCFKFYFLYTSWAWRLDTCSSQSLSSINHPQVGGMFSILTPPPPFLDLSCSYVEFMFCVFRNLYGLIKTEICICYPLSSLLYRQEQEK